MNWIDQVRVFLQQEIELYGDEPAFASRVRRSALISTAAFAVPGSSAVDTGDSDPPVPLNVEPAQSLEELDRILHGCRQCSLGAHGAGMVFGAGDPHADIVLVGEQPSQQDGKRGALFSGEPGELLDRILSAISLNREKVYLATLLKCSAAGESDPKEQEAELCLPYLLKQLALIQPKFILAMGRTAAGYLLRTKEPLSRLRGRLHSYGNTQVIVTYAPATLLRYPQFKRETWADVQLLRRAYDEYIDRSTEKS
ncbi:MAG: Uracil DNA glycosylase superfamily protein [bacterium ADurb.Bin478]|nr:MAG: Uracil DNA glycosylase superfamily protein [bacterium ADurb.Bin478]